MIRIVFLGTGVAVNVANKAQQSILMEDDRLILIDCGYGTMLRLHQAGYSVSDLDAIILTHFHLDHCGELMGILKARWLNNAGKIDIYSPVGGKEIFEYFLLASRYLNGKLKCKIHEIRDGESFSVGNMKFRARKTVHSMESMACIIEDLLISGDTSAFPELYEDVNFAIHEMSLDFGGNPDFHTSPENFAENAHSIERAWLIHLYPPAYRNRDTISGFLEKKGISVHFPDDSDRIDL